MEQPDPLAATEKSLKEAKKAKAELFARVEAARCMGAKVLLTLQQLEALNRQASSLSEVGTQAGDRTVSAAGECDTTLRRSALSPA
jgi:uncharacterized protein (DUF169 family)